MTEGLGRYQLRGKALLTAISGLLFAGFLTEELYAEVVKKHIPAEYESTSAQGVAMNNAGYAATDPHTAVRANPALLSLERQYSVSAGYHWPDAGRDFFQASVVDSKTSSVAAGVSYTGYNDDYVYPREQDAALKGDSPVIRRGVVGLASVFGQMSLGVGATYVEANPVSSSVQAQKGEDRIRGVGLNMGAAVAWNQQLRLGASVENISNKKISEYVPKTYRGGVAYGFSPIVTAYLDYRHRERVIEFEGQDVDLLSYEGLGVNDPPPSKNDADKSALAKPEQMVIGSLSVQAQDFLRLMGSYAQALTDDRRSLGGGVAVVNKGFVLSYTASRPYMVASDTHQAISLGIDLAM